MKKYLTASNVAITLLLIGIAIQIIVILTPHKPKNTDPVILKQVEELTEQLRKNDIENKHRDSVLLVEFQRNHAAREIQLSKAKQTANEKIDRINSSGFNADSVRRAFANN